MSTETLTGPKDVVEPEKELRFTRARQGYILLSIACIFFSVALTLFLTSLIPDNPVGTPLWAIPPLIPCILLIIPAIRCIRHAYIILTPLGIEIFPFRHAEKHLQVIFWSEINHAEVSENFTQLVIHRDEERTSGIIASLNPLMKPQRKLLARAISGRMEKTS